MRERRPAEEKVVALAEEGAPLHNLEERAGHLRWLPAHLGVRWTPMHITQCPCSPLSRGSQPLRHRNSSGHIAPCHKPRRCL